MITNMYHHTFAALLIGPVPLAVPWVRSWLKRHHRE